ncbi:hypothetical protein H1R20_g9366, partial [Candolleomyces eurysporus]
MVKIIFFYARYSPFVDVPLVFVFQFNTSRSLEFYTQYCRQLDRATIWLITIGILSTEAVLVIRTHGLVGGTRKYLIYLITQYALLCLTVFVVIGVSTSFWIYNPPPSWDYGCQSAQTPGYGRLAFLGFILLLIHEIIVMAITLHAGWTKYRDQQRTPLIRILYRDGTIYFILTSLISLASIINSVTNSQENTALLAVFQRVVHSILSTRIILQARKAAFSTEEDPIGGLPLSALNRLEETTQLTTTTTKGEEEDTYQSAALNSHS